MRVFLIIRIANSDGSDGFYGTGKITDPADPVYQIRSSSTLALFRPVCPFVAE